MSHNPNVAFTLRIRLYRKEHDPRIVTITRNPPHVRGTGSRGREGVAMAIDKITREDARMWGREAFDMGLTLARAIQDITECGCPARYLPDVTAAWQRARGEAIHREA